MDAPTAMALYDALEGGMDAMRNALLARDAEALARSATQLEQSVARWQAAKGDALQPDIWRERAFALRMKNMHNGRLLLADLNWIGAVTRWLQGDGGGETYAANGAGQGIAPARLLDYRG